MNPLEDMDYIREDLHVEALALVHVDFLESRVCSEVYITRKYLNKIYEIKVQNKKIKNKVEYLATLTSHFILTR